MKHVHQFFIALVFSVFVSVAVAGEAPMKVAGATTVDAAAAKALFDSGALFVDPRRESEFEAGRIPDAVSLELKKKFNEESLAAELKKDEPVVFYCNGSKCLRSSKAAAKAVGWGYSKVYYFRGGFPAWKAAGYPVE